MPIPSQTDMFSVVLDFMRDGQERSRKQIVELVRECLGLTPAECAIKTSSGKPVYESRIGWSVSYLNRAKYLDRVSRGVYRINAEGLKLLESGISGAKAFSAFANCHRRKRPLEYGSS